ncbi:MAG: acetoin utilization protein AcuC [Verrucomicrobia bacterium]|nr:acetoin utilization protein AcuC [Verrucomicrobiota bacterium]
MKDRKLAFIYTPEVERLSYPADCPFKTQRAGLTRQRLVSFGLLGSEQQAEVVPRQATLAELQQFHPARYLEELQRAAAGDLTIAGLHMGIGGPDTPVFKDLFEYGSWACGAALTAADWLLAGKADIAFNLLGGFHHAMAEKAAGFCYLNDVVLACMRLTAAGKRVACLDVDAHHGDGTQAAFYTCNEVLTISLHESGKTLFPWGGFENEIGEGPGLGYNANVSLPAGTYDGAFLLAFDRVAVPLLEAYNPDVIVVELGMDALSGDPLTHLCLTNNALMDALGRLLRLDKPLLIVGGGGYHVENTVRGWALAWRTCGGEDEHDFSAGMGGCMLASAEWVGGLRDRELAVTSEQRQTVEAELHATIATVANNVFPYHGLGILPASAGASAS